MPLTEPDVDDPGRIGTRCPSTEQRQQLLGEHEDTLDVHVHHSFETLGGIGVDRAARCGACVVDQHVDLLRAARELGDQRMNAVDRSEVGGKSDALPELAKAFGGFTKDVCISRGDVYPCARLHETFGNYFADAAAPSRHHDNFAGHPEKVDDVAVCRRRFGVACHGVSSSGSQALAGVTDTALMLAPRAECWSAAVVSAFK